MSLDKLEKGWYEIVEKAVWSWDKPTGSCWIKLPDNATPTEIIIKNRSNEPRNLFLTAIVFGLQTIAWAQTGENMIYKSDSYSIYNNRVEQAGFKATVLRLPG